MNANKIISPDNKCFDYMGRIDFENPERPMFIWAGSNTQTIFTGKSLSVIVRNYAFQKDAHHFRSAVSARLLRSPRHLGRNAAVR